MADTRTPRTLENRETSERPAAWRPPELLPEPVRQPGFDYRWIRTSIHDKADPRNISAKLREGWEPVGIEEQPHMKMLIDPAGRFKDNIEIGGLLLCKTPEEFVKQRNDYYNRQAQAQTEAVDNNFMRQSDSRMPLFKEGKSEVKFGKGK